MLKNDSTDPGIKPETSRTAVVYATIVPPRQLSIGYHNFFSTLCYTCFTFFPLCCINIEDINLETIELQSNKTTVKNLNIVAFFYI